MTSIPKFIAKMGQYYLMKKYGLAKGSLHKWENIDDPDHEFSALIRLAFIAVDAIERGKIPPPDFVDTEVKKK